MRCKTLSRLHHSGTLYQPGETVDLDPDQADVLVDCGVVERVESDDPPRRGPGRPRKEIPTDGEEVQAEAETEMM